MNSPPTLGEASLTELAQRREAIRLLEPRDSVGPKTYEPVLAMPVVAAGGLAAIMLYGGHNTGDDVTGEEHVVLRELVATAGNAYDRVEAISLNRQVERLSKKLEVLPYDIGVVVDDLGPARQANLVRPSAVLALSRSRPRSALSMHFAYTSRVIRKLEVSEFAAAHRHHANERSTEGSR
jgi:hypothetical protein